LIATPADDVLDRTAEIVEAERKASQSTPVESQIEADGLDEVSARARPRGLARVGHWLQRAWQFFVTQTF